MLQGITKTTLIVINDAKYNVVNTAGGDTDAGRQKASIECTAFFWWCSKDGGATEGVKLANAAAFDAAFEMPGNDALNRNELSTVTVVGGEGDEERGVARGR